ncbi:beta strand repeat-containing protein [Singulisphaera sp. PoT]|uniref:beta strand repeat-containing protein n=1 Tax=Singulisphaera sp. PoT TaxID=3411797 RepID=UPI003BF48075
MAITSRIQPWGFRRSGKDRDGRLRRGAIRPVVQLLEDRSLLATFTVTTTTDNDTTNGDTGSLRQAIIDLNKSTDASNTINFNINASGVQSIALKADLPEIKVPVLINGYSQPGSSPNSSAIGDNAILLIELNGSGATKVGLNISAGSSTVQGLIINRFPGNGIELRGNGGNTIIGNFIGTNAAGTAALPNGGSGISILDSPTNTIGGAVSASRNIISGNGTNGILVDLNDAKASAPATGSNSSSNLIQNNYIGLNASATATLNNKLGNGVFINNSAGNQVVGNTVSGNSIGVQIGGTSSTNNVLAGNFIGTDPLGSVPLGNQVGVSLGTGAHGNLIGGTTSTARNIISGNVTSGIAISDSNPNLTELNIIQGNYIGTKVDGINGLGNGGDGILLVASKQTIGGTTAGAPNIIAFNGGAGVNVSTGSGNAIVSNSIFGNHVGILLSSTGNGNQAAPALNSITSVSGSTLVRGTVTSTANTQLTIQFYANPNLDPGGNAEGKTLLGSSTVTTNSSGVVSFAILLPSSFPFGQYVTATVTTVPGNNTSPFSQPLVASVHTSDVGVYLPASDTFALAFLNPSPYSSSPFTGQSVFPYGGHVGTNYSIPITGDFNGDGITDVGIYVPSTDTFAIAYLNSQGQISAQRIFQYGAHVGNNFSVPVTGDFNGDGTTDVGLYVPTTDTFALAFLNPSPSSPNPFIGQNVFQYGAHTGTNYPTPITGDFNADGVTDVGLFVPASSTFALAYLNPTPVGSVPILAQSVFVYGSNANGVNSIPVTGDFNADGVTDVGIFAPAIDTFALAFLSPNPSGPSVFLGQSVFRYGSHTGTNYSVPITGDFNGDATTDVGIYAPTTSLFALAYLNPRTTGSNPFVGQRVFVYGTSVGGVASVPITGDFNGSGAGTIAASVSAQSIASDKAPSTPTTEAIHAQSVTTPAPSSSPSSKISARAIMADLTSARKARLGTLVVNGQATRRYGSLVPV